MTQPQLNEEVVDQIDSLGTTEWSGTTYRYARNGRDPLSGAGARLNGGRWNPRGVFPAVYLGRPRATIAKEFVRAAGAAGMAPAAMLTRGWSLHTVEVDALRALDLREPTALNRLGLNEDDIRDDDRSACQVVGHAAWFLDFEGIVAPSATGEGLVVVAFEDRVRPSVLTLATTEPFAPII